MSIQEHKLIELKISDIKLDPSNPNQMSQEQMAALRKSMQTFGYLAPVVVDQNNLIADGEHRVLIYKEFKKETVPAFRVQMDDTQRRLYRQTANKLRGMHNPQMDADEMALIYEKGKLSDLAQLLATQDQTLKDMMLRYRPELPFGHEDDEQLDQIIDEQLKRTAPDTQLGDIYQLGNHKLICADCTDKRSIDNLFEDKRCDMLLTDPPYGVEYGEKNASLNRMDGGHRIETPYLNDELDRDYQEFFSNFLKLVPLADYNTVYVAMSDQTLLKLSQALIASGIKISQYLIWVKNNHVLSRTDYAYRHEFIVYGWKDKHKFYGDFSTTVLEYDKPLVNDLHPTMKPLALIAKLIKDGSQADMLVYDPFLGSGSTLIACEQTGRRCYGVEIDPHYCDVVVKRWEAYTNQKAVRNG